MAPKLAISRLSKSFGDLEALRGINLGVDRGEFISVVGPSGCGKTTFLRIVAGLEHATSGDVLLDGRAAIAFVRSFLTLLSGQEHSLLLFLFDLYCTSGCRRPCQ